MKTLPKSVGLLLLALPGTTLAPRPAAAFGPGEKPRQLSTGLNYYITGHNAKLQATVDWSRNLEDDETLAVQNQPRLTF